MSGERVGADRRVLLFGPSELDPVTRQLRDLGALVERVELSASGSTRSLESWISELVGGAFDDVLFLTGQGVRVLAEFAHQRGREDEVQRALSRVRLAAAGSKTRSALAELGFRPAIVGNEPGGPSLREVLAATDFSGRSLGIAALSCDPAIMAAARGASIRLLGGEEPLDSRPRALLARILGSEFDCIAFGSPRELESLFASASAAQRGDLSRALRRSNPIALGQATARALAERGVSSGVVLERAALVRPRGIDFRTVFGVDQRKSGESMTSARGEKKRGRKSLVVIGNGMVGYKLCELVTEYDRGESYDISVFCEEPRPAYDRVRLTSFFQKESADELLLAGVDWYKERRIRLLLGESALTLDRERRAVQSSSGEWIRYDQLVLCTGSAPFVPPIPGIDKLGVFVYRTIEDLERIRNYAKNAKTAVVLGGGLLGLEAAKAAADLGLSTHVVEFAPRLMPRQLDVAGARLLARSVEALGVKVHVARAASAILGEAAVEGIAFREGDPLATDLVIVSAGIRPRDELARAAGLALGERGGVLVNAQLRSSDPDIFAIGEVALHDNTLYGLVTPGYQMAEVCARTLTGEESSFAGSDQSAKLKLLGTDVASFGDPFAENGAHTIAFEDLVKGVYKKLVVSPDKKHLVGGVLVGDASEYASLVQFMRSGEELPSAPEDLLFGAREGKSKLTLADSAQVCSCNNVTKGQVCKAVRAGVGTLIDLKAKTKVGTGCGGCMPLVTDLLNAELAAAGKAVKKELCEHFALSRQELYQIVKVKRIRSFRELVSAHGKGNGCEVCKPLVASLLASVNNDMILQHDTLQDSNDRYLANLQRGGLYSVVPRIPAGEITPEKLIRLGEIAKKYGLYTKVTGGQRIDMFGARVEQLPEIWEELVAAGFESGHAYGKAMRTVKSCVGSTWCRFGVQDSVSFAIRVEERYKGIRAPHKLKSAVSGCIRECAEAQSKDFGLIATEKGWNLYVCGNGGAKPRHADLLASDLDEETALRYVDRFLMFYIRTADRLTRTSTWLDKMDGGIEQLRDVIMHDKLGICDELEREVQYLVDTYACEWAEVVKDPAKRARFRHYANTAEADDSIEIIDERGQRRPRDWQKTPSTPPVRDRRHLPLIHTSWVKVANMSEFPEEGGMAVKYGKAQIAIYNFTSRGEWYACQNLCPHMHDMVLARGLIGDQGGIPKVACPQHKKTFSLKSGECLSGDALKVRTFPVKVEGGAVYLELPSEAEIDKLMPIKAHCDGHEESASAAE